MHQIPRFCLAVCALFLVGSAVAADKVVNVYNWSDYITEDALKGFEKETGIKVVYDVYDSNEVLEAKLLAGRSGYDLVFPSAHPFAQRQIQAGIFAKLDKTRLTNSGNLDPELMKTLTEVDSGNEHVVPYMWGTTGLGINVEKVRSLLGVKDIPMSWKLVFDPAYASKLAKCGISMMDDEQEAFAAALLYLGKNPNSSDEADIEAAANVLREARPNIKYYHNSKYIGDLANGDLCLVHGYSGDIFQARDRAVEAKNNVTVQYLIPVEGTLLWTDVMAIPKDAPHPQEAHAFINYMMQPSVIAGVSNFVAYANANIKATPLVDAEVRNNPGIYPSADVKKRLVTPKPMPKKVQRLKTRNWTRIKGGQ